jgi:hypothetical protein
MLRHHLSFVLLALAARDHAATPRRRNRCVATWPTRSTTQRHACIPNARVSASFHAALTDVP